MVLGQEQSLQGVDHQRLVSDLRLQEHVVDMSRGSDRISAEDRLLEQKVAVQPDSLIPENGEGVKNRLMEVAHLDILAHQIKDFVARIRVTEADRITHIEPGRLYIIGEPRQILSNFLVKARKLKPQRAARRRPP